MFFTADTHFYHGNVIKSCKRPQYFESDYDEDGRFLSIELKHLRTRQMNEMLIDNWNSVVGKKDEIYHLGDFSFSIKNIEQLLKSLNGKIHLITGNHDKKMPFKTRKLFASCDNYKYMKIRQIKVALFHHPIAVWDCCHYGSLHLHGHSHGQYKSSGRVLDVGVDCHEYKPISFDHVIELIGSLGYTSHHYID